MSESNSAAQPTRSDILRHIEIIFAERYIMPHLNNPSEETLKQVFGILKTQFEKTYCGEVGGSIFHQPTGLEFLLVRPKKLISLEEKLALFEAGEIADYNELASIAEPVVDNFSKKKAKNGGELRFYILNEFYNALKSIIQEPERVKKITPENRKEISDCYKQFFLNSRYPVLLSELEAPGKNLISIFHVHPSGLGPSEEDLIANQKLLLPIMVIAGTSNYQTSGVRIHLIYSGTSHLLYGEPVKAQNY
ncbi:MAG: hypothetical protein AABW48_06410 [Nanoarchaeota archaeon]